MQKTESEEEIVASIKKIAASNVGMLLKHNNRTPNDEVDHSNEDIDDSMTMYNYHYKKGTAKDVSKRIDEVFYIEKEGTVTLGEVVVTLPKDTKEEDERKFFQAIYDFYCMDFGEKNVINAVVHKDENRPHIHIDFVPVKKENVEFKHTQGKALEKWKKEHGIGEGEEFERLCGKGVITKKYLDSMHTRLFAFVKGRLGYSVEILNGATVGGNKTVQRLKAQRYEEEKEQLEKEVNALKHEMNKVRNIMNECGIQQNDLSLLPLLRKIEHLETANKTLQQIVLKNNCTYTKEELEQMRPPKKYAASQCSRVNVYDGSITQLNIEDNSLIVLEMFDKVERPLPQQALIDRSSDIAVQQTFATRIPENIVVRPSRVSARKYIFIKTDDSRQTIDLLIELSKVLAKELKEGRRKIYMDRMENDEFDFAKSILEKADTDVCYCTRLSLEEKQAENESKAEQVKQIM